MARISLIAREAKREKMYQKFAAKRAQLKAEGKWEELQKLPLNSSPSRRKNRCLLSGRPQGYMRDFGMNRITFRELANEGKIPGVKKSSW